MTGDEHDVEVLAISIMPSPRLIYDVIVQVSVTMRYVSPSTCGRYDRLLA